MKSKNLSPCISICKLNEKSFCTGCGRSMENIRLWSSLSEEDKVRISEESKERLVAMAL